MSFIVLHLLDGFDPSRGQAAFTRIPVNCGANWTRWRAGPRTCLMCSTPARAWKVPGEITDRWIVLDGFVSRPERVDANLSAASPSTLTDLVLDNGAAACDLIGGHFALCVIDGARDRIAAMRDRTGGRVVYWARQGSRLAISNRAELVASCLDVGEFEDPAYLAHLFALRSGNPPGRTVFRHVHELLPGALLDIRDGTVEVVRNPVDVASDELDLNQSQWVEAFFEAFKQGVADTIGDHDSIAVMLSGGMDSIPVLSAAREFKRFGRRVVAVSWSLPKFPPCDETRWIRCAAEAMGVEARIFRGDRVLPFDRLTTDVVLPGVPVFNPFRDLILACYREAAAANCRVVLNGSRGDLLYANHLYLIHDLIRRRDFSNLWRELAGLVRRIGLRGTLASAQVRYPVARRFRRPPTRPGTGPLWLTPWARENLDDAGQWPPEASGHPYPLYAAALLGTTMSHGPAQEQEFALRYGVDRREPFQNPTLVRLMLAAPVVMSHGGGLPKRVMREAMRGRIPEQLRLKSRTGILTDFLLEGFSRNRDRIRSLLTAGGDASAKYIARAPALGCRGTREQIDSQIVLAGRCVGYQLWRVLSGSEPAPAEALGAASRSISDRTAGSMSNRRG